MDSIDQKAKDFLAADSGQDGDIQFYRTEWEEWEEIKAKSDQELLNFCVYLLDSMEEGGVSVSDCQLLDLAVMLAESRNLNVDEFIGDR